MALEEEYNMLNKRVHFQKPNVCFWISWDTWNMKAVNGDCLTATPAGATIMWKEIGESIA